MGTGKGKRREVDGGKWWDIDAGDMSMNEQSSASWDVLVCRPLNGFRVCILADAWVAEVQANEPRNEQRGGEHQLAWCKGGVSERWVPAEPIVLRALFEHAALLGRSESDGPYLDGR